MEERLTKRQRRLLKRQQRLQAQQASVKKRKIKRIITWLVAVLLLAAASYGVTQLASLPSSDNGVVLADIDIAAPDDWIKGNLEAKITLIEYSDFECPACASYFPMVKQLIGEFGKNMKFVYRHFPLSSIHSFAELAARASEAAGLQDKFWQMHDLIFENQAIWSKGKAKDMFISFAETLELDVEKFKQDLGSKEVKDAVKNDYSSGLKAGINSTPTFFLNGKKINNPRNYNEFADLIRNEIIDQETITKKQDTNNTQ